MAYEKYDEDVLELEHHINTSEEEDDEMPTRIHGYLQFQILYPQNLHIYRCSHSPLKRNRLSESGAK